MLAHFITSAAFIFSLFEGIVAVPSSEIDVFRRSPDARTLFPHSKRVLGLKTRDIVRRALHPQTKVVLSYGEDSHFGHEQYLFAVDITLVADDSVPIILLEDFEDLTSSITCTGDTIEIRFSDHSDFDYTQEAWSSLQEFVLISSHPGGGCNPSDERGAYRVKHTYYDASKSTVKLSTEILTLHNAAPRSSVDFGHITREDFHQTLSKRQTTPEEVKEDKEDDTFNFHSNGTFSLNTSFPTRVTLYPLNLPITVGGGGVASPLDVGVTCVNCFIKGELVLRGHLDIDQDLADGTELQWAWAEIEVTKVIETNLQLELFLAIAKKSWEFGLIPKPIPFTPFQIPGFISIGPEFDYNCAVELGFGAMEANFTYGGKIDIPVGAIARFDFDQTAKSFARGWDKTELKQIPFVVNSLNGDLDINLNVTAKPSVAFKITLLSIASDGFSAGPSIDFSAPKIMLGAKQLQNVTKNCGALGKDDYEYYDNAFQFSTNWELGVGISITAEADFPLLPSLGASFSHELYTHTFVPTLVCRAFGGSTKTGELKPAESVTPKIDIPKLQANVDKTGVLPPGVDSSILASITSAGGPLPTSIKTALDTVKPNDASRKVLGGGEMLGLLVAVGAVAMIL